MFAALIEKSGTMRIEPGFLDLQIDTIGKHLKNDCPVILDTDNKRLEAMASQMGLSVVYDDL